MAGNGTESRDETGFRRGFDAGRVVSMTGDVSAAAILEDAELPTVVEGIQIMPMPAAASSVTTIEGLLALPEDGRRHELLDGVHCVTPSPSLLHQAFLREIEALLLTFLRSMDRLELFWSPADIVLGPRTLVQPDLFVVDRPSGGVLHSWSEVGVPVLVIEVLSPGTAARDRGSKRRIYQGGGVAEYWIVDLDARLVERWRPGDTRPEVLADTLTWRPAPELPELTVALGPLFERVLGA